jgi:hypothetical protein
MFIPRAQSDPGAQRRTALYQMTSHPTMARDVQLPPVPMFNPQPSSQNVESVPWIHTFPVTAEEEFPDCAKPQTRQKKRRSKIMRWLFAPLEALESLLRKMFAPSDNCMRCINITYWVTIIITAIISTAIALAAL